MLTNSQTILILLAGGQSSRAETIKGLRVVNDHYWIDVVLQHYQQMGLSNNFIGLGYNHEQYLTNSCFLNSSSNNVNYSINQNPVEGSFSTLQSVLKKSLNQQWDFALLLHIDCALISENTINALLAQTKYNIVKPICQSKSGHPIKLSRNFCKTLLIKPKNSQLDEEIRNLDKSHIFWQQVKDNSIHYNLNTEQAWKDYIGMSNAE